MKKIKTYLELLPNHIEEEIFNMKIRSDFIDVKKEMLERHNSYLHNKTFTISYTNYKLLKDWDKYHYYRVWDDESEYYYNNDDINGYYINEYFKKSFTESIIFNTKIRLHNSHKKILSYVSCSPDFVFNNTLLEFYYCFSKNKCDYIKELCKMNNITTKKLTKKKMYKLLLSL